MHAPFRFWKISYFPFLRNGTSLVEKGGIFKFLHSDSKTLSAIFKIFWEFVYTNKCMLPFDCNEFPIFCFRVMGLFIKKGGIFKFSPSTSKSFQQSSRHFWRLFILINECSLLIFSINFLFSVLITHHYLKMTVCYQWHQFKKMTERSMILM